MEHSSDISLSEPTMASEAELIRLVQALTILPSQQREVLLRILSTAPSFDALQIDLAAHPELQVALEHYSLDRPEAPKYQQSLEQLSPFVPASLSVSFQRAIATTVRYRWTNNMQALEEATSSWEYIFHHPDFPHSGSEFRRNALNTGGISFYLRYFAQRQVRDLSRGQMLYQQALEQTPLNSEKRAIPLCNLSIGLFTHYDLTGNLADLEQGLQYLQEALHLIPPDSPTKPSCLVNLGAGLNRRYARTGQLADLEKALQLWYKALNLIPPASLNRYTCLINLGNGLVNRYAHIRQLEDLEQGIEHLYEALSLIPPDSPDRFSCLMDLGRGLQNRYAHNGQLADLEQAVSYYQEALAQLSPTSPMKALCLEKLGRALITRYDETGVLADLEQSIQFGHQALALTPTSSELRVELLISLSRGLRRLYKHSGKLADLEQCIPLLREAFSLISPHSPNRANLLNSLGIVLSERYDLTKDQTDQDKALQCFNQALSLEPPDLHLRSNILTNLGLALHTQYTLTGNLTDLERAIQCWQQAVDEVPTGDPTRVVHVANLATGLYSLYETTGKLENLDQALHLDKQVINSISPGSPDRAACLHNLGRAFLSRYFHTRKLIDLEQAISSLQQALDETTLNVVEQIDDLNDLGGGLYTYYLRIQKMEYLERAISVLEQGWSFLHTTFVTLPMSYKLGQQKRWFHLYTNLISAYLLLAAIDRSTAVISRRKALEVAESAKSRLLTQLVGQSTPSNPVDIPSEIIARERVLLSELIAIDNAALVSSIHRTLDEWDTDHTENYHYRERRLQELEHLWASISEMSPEGHNYVALRRGDTPTWADLLHLVNDLGPQTALLSFIITNDRTRLFLTRKGWRGPRFVDISLPENKWLDLLLRFSREVPGSNGSSRRGETWDQPLQELLKQASKHLVGVKRLILSTQGAGHLLPWSVVFQRTGYQSSDGGSMPLVTLPALGVLPRLRQRPRSLDGPTLVIGNPRGDLPFAEQEAQVVSAQFGVTPLLGSQATKAAVLAHFEHASLIHLATHAFFVLGAPLEASIELADGVLTAQEVLQLRLQADLLVLSGCETGKAEALGGEELAGLAQAFLQAGVRSLLVSLWPVNDLASATLMVAFYQARQTGADKAQALRQAMTTIQQDPRWHHPYYWGAFVLMGDWE